MKLAQLLQGVLVTKLFQTMFGRMVVTHDVEVSAIQYDSRKIARGGCFVAIRGTGVDGHRFISTAISNGASVVVLEDDAILPDSYFMHAGVAKVVVPDSRKALAQLAANYYDHPSKKLSLIGVTGTNGKTTTTHIIKSILEASGETVGLIGTIEYAIGSTTFPATHTTPESLELNELLSRMVKAGCTSVSMEVSSHALHQSRVVGLAYRAAVFTNLTQDHLDYHGSMEEYCRAKKILFDGLPAEASAVINQDDSWGLKIVQDSAAQKVLYSATGEATVSARDIKLSIEGTVMTVLHNGQSTAVTSPLVGQFNAYNILAAFSTGIALGLSPEVIRQGIGSLKAVRGRFERMSSPKGWTAIVDYAHTPDALEKCLHAIRDVLPKNAEGKIITVFGAGGDRDKTKRPLMGAVAGSLSDVVLVTSDNPRTEEPGQIIKDILEGIPAGTTTLQQPDRRKAIEQAVSMARAGDVILIAGKGHEDYQVIGTERIHFSDQEVVGELAR